MPNVKQEAFDQIHDTQHIYRQLLDAMAFPGTVRSILASCSKLEAESPVYRMVTALALTLLDNEVSFAVDMEEGRELESYITHHTFCRIQSVSTANYIFAEGKYGGEHLEKHFVEINRGSLVQPDFGATLFLLVDQFVWNTETPRWLLSGPGIPGEAGLDVEGLSEDWIGRRAEWNAEYPTGVDVVLFNPMGEIVALPRTTIMKGAKS